MKFHFFCQSEDYKNYQLGGGISSPVFPPITCEKAFLRRRKNWIRQQNKAQIKIFILLLEQASLSALRG
jgi:hypothetical protein